MPNDGVVYALLRLDFELRDLVVVKFLTVCWVGEHISVMRRARISVHLSSVEALFGYTHLTVRTDRADLAPEDILRSLNISMGYDVTGDMFGRLANVVYMPEVPAVYGAVEFTDYDSVEQGKRAMMASKAAMEQAMADMAKRHEDTFASLFFSEADAIVCRCIFPQFPTATGVYAADRVVLASDTLLDLLRLLASTIVRRAENAAQAYAAEASSAAVLERDESTATGAASSSTSESAAALADLQSRFLDMFGDPSAVRIAVSVVERIAPREHETPKSALESAASDAQWEAATYARLSTEDATQVLARSIGWDTQLGALRVVPTSRDEDSAAAVSEAAARLHTYRHLKKIHAHLEDDALVLTLY
ncbi:uncharacterized protein AMSG_00530 [Thecamonas trahens ATCC 50062]|uniref:ADF-H domain-containing protein n=1 Tax=Thecamonas trahens ATCC 50062 TaxID=461836 RepID=A0A0L0DBS3_THETB|nr:hypothetical protein AMSG_00530 [Thecamonas trahens ATCC 50062]KNC48753.1 hypothetical protein AMSG_00530 [Thecamonas trahens ATCC 50062]|eukprot:XP_013762804.1 hypothetical protein AMSG_00530 [Thecamonas trahens ATCC 50062]